MTARITPSPIPARAAVTDSPSTDAQNTIEGKTGLPTELGAYAADEPGRGYVVFVLQNSFGGPFWSASEDYPYNMKSAEEWAQQVHEARGLKRLTIKEGRA